MEQVIPMKIVREFRLRDGTEQVRCATMMAGATVSQIAYQMMASPGVGAPFYAFANESVPAEITAATLLETNWDGAATVTGSVAANVALINGMLGNPPPIGVANNGVNKVWVEPAAP